MPSQNSPVDNLLFLLENENVLRFKNNIIRPVISILMRLKVGPTAINIVGLLFGIVASIMIWLGEFHLALVLLLLAGLSDLIDGELARALNQSSAIGAFLDSVLDRYVDLGIFIAVTMYYVKLEDHLMVFVTLMGLVGASLTSYVASRAASLGVNRHVGWISRPQRIILLLLGIAFPAILSITIWLLAIFGNITAVYRIKFFLSTWHIQNENANNY